MEAGQEPPSFWVAPMKTGESKNAWIILQENFSIFPGGFQIFYWWIPEPLGLQHQHKSKKEN
jgi:hypothetical protein